MLEKIKKKISIKYLMNYIFSLFFLSTISCYYQTKNNHFIVFSNNNQTVMNTDIIDVNDYSDLFQDKYKIIYCESLENFSQKIAIYSKNTTYQLVKFNKINII
jgi:hypothetical protein